MSDIDDLTTKTVALIRALREGDDNTGGHSDRIASLRSSSAIGYGTIDEAAIAPDSNACVASAAASHSVLLRLGRRERGNAGQDHCHADEVEQANALATERDAYENGDGRIDVGVALASSGRT
jgi:hypothetical protein